MVIKKRNKKAWLRIVEATLSVIIILSAVLIFYQSKQVKQTDNFADNLPTLVDEVVKNDAYRGEILHIDFANVNSVGDTQKEINLFLSGKIDRPDLNYSFIICKADESCSLPKISNLASDVYSYERIVSTNLTQNFDSLTTPRKVKLYIWKIA